MDEKQLEKLIGFAVVAIFTFYILQMVIPFLVWAVIAMVAWRIYLEFNKYK